MSNSTGLRLLAHEIRRAQIISYRDTHAWFRFDVTGEGVIDGRDLLEMEKAYAESLMQRYSDPITYSKLSSRRWRKRKMGRPTALTGRDIEVDGFPGGRPFLALRPLMKSQDAPPEESKGQVCPSPVPPRGYCFPWQTSSSGPGVAGKRSRSSHFTLLTL